MAEKKGKLRDDKILLSVRKEIDLIDEEILELLNRRARISRRVGRIKAGGSKQVFKPAREAALLDKLEAMNPGPLPAQHLRSIYSEIISSSRSLQFPQKVVYLGPEGTFSYYAGLEYLGRSAEYTPRANFEGVFAAVWGREADLGVIPLENSLQGTVGQSLDLFIRYELFIQAEVYSRISHSLLSNAEEIGQIEEVFSHPQPLAQCGGWLRANMPGAKLTPVESTAKAASMVAGKKNSAAIGNRNLAERYELGILAEPIEDAPDNWTRFVIIGTEPLADKDNAKTSMLLTTAAKPGSLASALNAMADDGINLTKLESRPHPGEKWKYVFFADVECDLYRKEYSASLTNLKKSCEMFRLLGSYCPGKH